MIYYFLPDPRIFGGIKVGYQFVQLLNDLRVPAVVASPQGKAPQWFSTSAAVLDEKEVLDQITKKDWIIFSLPYDYDRLKKTSVRIIFHCQGTNPIHDPTFRDSETLILTCWDQATRYVWDNYRREAVEVGIAISDCFYRSNPLTYHGMVSYMPRRGENTAATCIEENPDLFFQPIKGLNEVQVATIMQQSEYYLATSEGEWFGLPALEAMAAGCLVLTVPVLGGMDYLRDEDNCLVVEPETMPEKLSWIAAPEQMELRKQIRYRAMATAASYRLTLQKKQIAALLQNKLKGLTVCQETG